MTDAYGVFMNYTYYHCPGCLLLIYKVSASEQNIPATCEGIVMCILANGTIIRVTDAVFID
jgi:hypothetical protein